MKKILLSLFTLSLITLSAIADEQKDALDFFNNYVDAANTYSSTIADMYSPSAKIIRQVVKPDGTTVDVATDTATYVKQMKIGQAGAKLRHYTNSYSNIVVSDAGNGAYRIASLRQPSGEDYKLKTYMIVKKRPNGNWEIIEEMMQTKVQTFLRYANKN